MTPFRRLSPGQGVHGNLAWLNRPGALWGAVAACTLVFFLLHWPSSSSIDSPKPVELNGGRPTVAGSGEGAQAQRQSGASAGAAAAAAAALPSAPADKVLLELFVMSMCARVPPVPGSGA
jgi:hypothetical protein